MRPATVVAAVLVAIGLTVAGCGGQRAGSPTPAPSAAPSLPGAQQAGSRTPGPAGSDTAAPTVSITVSGGTTPPPAAVFRASTSVLTAAMRTRMTGVSWHRGCPVGLSSLRLLRLSYWGFDHLAHQGELVVNASAAATVTRAFRSLFAARFPIRQMRVVDDFGGDDERSMLADNTSAFNCRIVPGTTAWSQHAYGLAVDVDPFENPEISGGAVDPPAAAAWADRSRASAAMIRHGDAAWRAFDAIGWPWGGDWTSPKDYQHFSANGL
jgi:poly-gamma-glutamate synthesis protein (capsule biosynthesis protein)